MIREAVEGDLEAVLAIYNDVIATSTAVFSDQPTTLDERRAWLLGRRRQGHPVLVAAESNGILGFASYGDFRSWPGYRFTVEHSVHVRADRRGTGVGRSLMERLLVMAAEAGKHAMVAGVDAANEGSIRFHKNLGFEEVGYLREVGWKFDRWLDLVFLERMLGSSLGA